jgi:hypothetical protein
MSELTTTVQELATALQEENVELLERVVSVVGIEQAQVLLQKTLETEAGGGLLVTNQSRRRTPGGVFFYLARTSLPKQAVRQIWPPALQAQQPAAAAHAPSWEEAKQLIAQAIKNKGEAKTVKLTLVGRPGKVIEQEGCVVVSMKGKEPPSLPKGLPTLPENSTITWAVFIAKKQWTRVKDSMQKNAEDQLIIEGWPAVDPKRGIAIVLATNCKCVLMERAQRNQQAPAS